MAITPRLKEVVQVAPYFGHLPGGTPTPAGSVLVTGTADPGVTIALNDSLNGGALLASTTSGGDGNWFLGLSFFQADPLGPGLHGLLVTSYPSGFGGPAGAFSAPVGVSVGTDGADTLAGQVLSSGIAGPRYVFGGPGDDTIIAYTVAPDAGGNHAVGGAVTIDGGRERAGDGLDTVLLPTPLADLQSHQWQGTSVAGSPILLLRTADASVALLQVERIGFADVTITVQHDPLADFLFYDAAYADVAAADADARRHYDTHGWREGRDPNAFFDTEAYLAVNRDVQDAGTNPLSHYDAHGWREGRDPSAAFDTGLYLAFNPDVAAAGIDPLAHYLRYGVAEGRKTSPVVDAGEVRDGFDPTYYALANADIARSGMDAQDHFDRFGWREGRDPDAFFDTAGYLARNADVRAAGINPLEHYMAYGWREGRDPSTHFDTDAYLARYTDVAAARVNPLQHFLQYGIAEGRSAFGDPF